MHREKFPERIPFRLTRMLSNAMEVSVHAHSLYPSSPPLLILPPPPPPSLQVSGIHGSYKRSCEIAMEVLRDNKDSLMAVLEAFVYDPLIAWRLMPNNTAGGAREPERECLKRGRSGGGGGWILNQDIFFDRL